MATFATMPNDSPNARVLLQVSPDQYVTERSRLVKEARANRDKERATFFQSMKKPSVGLWAVLSAGDADAVHQIIKVTTDLRTVQASGSDPGSLAAATQRRRKVLESLVGAAVQALGKLDSGSGKRRPEIRAIVDQLSRHPELAEAWIDGSLRDLPDDDIGFGAFAGLDVSAPTPASAPAPKAKAPRRAEQEPAKPTRDLGAERAARSARAAQAREAKTAVAEAASEVAAAQVRVRAARAGVRRADEQLAVAEREHASAAQRHEKAVTHHESLR